MNKECAASALQNMTMASTPAEGAWETAMVTVAETEGQGNEGDTV
jgi:hypothetical protein